MTLYYLAEHVHAGIANEHLILIDLKNDQYYEFSPLYAKYMASIVTRRQIVLPKNSSDSGHSIATDFINELSPLGAIESNKPKNFRKSLEVNLASEDFTDATLITPPVISLTIIISFIQSLLRAIIISKLFGIYRLTNNVRKFQVSKNSVEHNNLEQYVYSFRKIRTFFYTAHDHCYFDCAVMTYFLKRGGFDAKWVFGVQMDPFQAHCWVQVNDKLVSDQLVRVFSFYPIVSI